VHHLASIGHGTSLRHGERRAVGRRAVEDQRVELDGRVVGGARSLLDIDQPAAPPGDRGKGLRSDA
jgi:hypothetical protein